MTTVEKKAPATQPRGAKFVNTFEDWPMEIQALVNALRRQPLLMQDRRRKGRQRYEVEGRMVVTENAQSRRSTIYTRDVTNRGVAFIGEVFMKAGQKVTLEIPNDKGGTDGYIAIIRRCRQFRDGWFDCAAHIESAVNPRS